MQDSDVTTWLQESATNLNLIIYKGLYDEALDKDALEDAGLAFLDCFFYAQCLKRSLAINGIRDTMTHLVMSSFESPPFGKLNTFTWVLLVCQSPPDGVPGLEG